MKIAYIARISPDNRGVLKKISRQMTHWKRMGHDVRSFFISPVPIDEFPVYPLWKRGNLLNPTLRLLLDVRAYQPDCIYMREDTLPVSRFLRFLFWRKKIVLEINSNYDTEGRLDYDSFFTAKRNFWLNYAVNHFFYHRLAGIVSVSYELLRLPHFSHCLHKIVIPNCIDVDDIALRKRPSSAFPIQLLFLGSPHHAWHGTDKIVHLAKALGQDFLFHLVGPTHDDIASLSPSSNIVAHGYRTDYADILQQCHIAIGTLALHRKKMVEASPLKVREYLACGFPVIIAYDDSALLEFSPLPDFVLKLPNTENNVNTPDAINAIRNFCLNNVDRIVSPHEVNSFIDSKLFEEKRISFMRDSVQ